MTTTPRPSIPVPVNERSNGVLIHLSPLLGYVFPSFGHLLGPLLAWLAFRDRDTSLDDQGKEALNFQISLTIYSLILSAVVTGLFILGGAGFFTGLAGTAVTGEAAPAFLGWFAFMGSFAALFAILVPVLLLFSVIPLIIMVLAIVSVNAGKPYRYPLTIRLIK